MRSRLIHSDKPSWWAQIGFIAVLTLALSGWTCTAIIEGEQAGGLLYPGSKAFEKGAGEGSFISPAPPLSPQLARLIRLGMGKRLADRPFRIMSPVGVRLRTRECVSQLPTQEGLRREN